MVALFQLAVLSAVMVIHHMVAVMLAVLFHNNAQQEKTQIVKDISHFNHSLLRANVFVYHNNIN